MNSTMADADTTGHKYGKKDWDEVRSGMTPTMSEVRLKALAEESGLPDWPLRGKGEVASKYIDYTWEELHELHGLAESPERIDLLIEILRETIAFEDPFGDMVATVDAATKREDKIGRNLARFEIDKEFPLRFSGLSSETVDFCQAEDIRTLGQFADFSHRMAQNIVVGGDFKGLLTALTAADEQGIAHYLPFRPGHKGLHLPEAIGLVLNQLAENEKYTLLKRYGAKLGPVETAKANLNKEQTIQLEEVLMGKVMEQCHFFSKQVPELDEKVRSGVSLERIFMVLNDPEKEAIAARVTARYLKQRRGLADEDEPARKKGFFGRLFGR
ncbi:hypothetical protein H5P28_18515 [Ruficoccus amylovorans]|uniref:Uncharacterized protein n=1 Tax=Ruficoccus amylovorans TaxID=1804625 RepID=A0A842HLC3_9BACT|nr:hypothetical protein [Ruficoccus amylovorans]MBC2596267.1 hypothetical protein [Ruficoccus amylovorans]